MPGFNPLDTRALTKVFANELTSRPAVILPEVDGASVSGPGLYALYYSGDFEPYARLASASTEWPIYLGSAMPRGSRTGQVRTGGKSPILDRLQRHAESITAALNLEEEKFHARWLEVDEPFIYLGETLLLRLYRPLWNAKVSGFGAKVVGGKRTTGRTSDWDTLHPGRQGRGTAPGATVEKVESEVEAHLVAFPPGWSLDSASTAAAATDG